MTSQIENIIKMADACQEKAYNMNYTNPDDEYNWWAIHETISLFIHYINENDKKAYRKIGKGLIEMLESNPLMEEFRQNLQIFLQKPKKLNKN
jgi:hypothetical protein